MTAWLSLPIRLLPLPIAKHPLYLHNCLKPGACVLTVDFIHTGYHAKIVYKTLLFNFVSQ